MNHTTNKWSVQVAGMLAITAATTAVFWIADGFEAAFPVALVLLAFTAVVHFGRRRSNTLEVMSGTGDERVRSLYTQAVAIAGTVMSFLLPGWWLVTVAQGDPNETLSLLCAIFGVSFILAIVVVARRG
jgi:4-amino-4-deoxy-L-arabinose transferase-like glycosyltransferase